MRTPLFARVLILATLLALFPELSNPGDRPSNSSIPTQVVRIVNGDTIEVCCIGGKQERVRYIGVNTPETSHPTKGVEEYGRQSK